jgi:hypothetical protein
MPDTPLPVRTAWATDTLAALAWAVSLVAVLALPHLTQPADVGDDRTRQTVRLALASYGVAASLLPWLRGDEWAAGSGRGRLARWCWTFSWATYLVHVALAFHYYHHWSHADALRHTQEVSGFGPGIFVSYLFTLAWTADVAWWWLVPRRYARRPVWIGWWWHGFMAVVIFNATVVYETGLIRWAGLALLSWLLADVLLAAVLAARAVQVAARDGEGTIVRSESEC